MPGRSKSKYQPGPGSGGPRRPENPAAASAGGAMSERTDGTVDLTGFQSQSYGQRDEVERLAAAGGGNAAPSPAGPVSPAGPGGGAGGIPPELDAFRPSDFPTMPASPFADMTAEGLGEDPDLLLRVAWQATRHPDILRLISMREGRL